MGEDNKRRSQRRTGVVLNNQVVALELPINVAVCLDLREGVTGQTKAKLTVHMFQTVGLAEGTRLGPLPEHGDEQVDEEDVGDQQINYQQNYHQPVAVVDPAGLLTVLNQCAVVCAAHVPLLPHWDAKRLFKLHSCIGK